VEPTDCTFTLSNDSSFDMVIAHEPEGQDYEFPKGAAYEVQTTTAGRAAIKIVIRNNRSLKLCGSRDSEESFLRIK
jgi:hypothetical protein